VLERLVQVQDRYEYVRLSSTKNPSCSAGNKCKSECGCRSR
ncbi:Alanine--tRNA ligase, partial [Trichinella spiralis]